jgi:hypothetical protein
MRSIDWSINGQLLQAVVVVNRPPFRGGIDPCPLTAEGEAAPSVACTKRICPFCAAPDVESARTATFCSYGRCAAIVPATLSFEVT